MDQNLIELFQKTDFTEKEARVYLALLELGQGNVREISLKADLKRPIVYVILESLMKRGYVSADTEAKINTYHASDPSIILQNMRTVTRHFSQILPFLQTMHNKSGKRPKITYYETKEAIAQIYEEMNYAREAFFISSYERIEQVFPGLVDKWLSYAKRDHYPLHGYNIVPETPREIENGKRFIQVNQKVRTLRLLNDSRMDFTIFKNKLAITSLEDEPFIVVIESQELVRSIKPIFELAWKAGKDIDVVNKTS